MMASKLEMLVLVSYVFKYSVKKDYVITLSCSIARRITQGTLIPVQHISGWIVKRNYCSTGSPETLHGATSSAVNSSKSSDQTNRMNGFIKKLQAKVLESATNIGKMSNEDGNCIVKNAVLTERRPVKQRYPKAYPENEECDKDILKCLATNDYPKALSCLYTFALQQQFPRRSTLLKLASISASNANVQGINILRDICELAFPAEVQWQMGFRHYEAEALWKAGKYDKSLTIFRSLFKKYPLQRRKLTNMLAFYMRHIMDENLVNEYPKLLDFVEMCMEVKEYGPAMNLWKAAFCATSFQAQNFAVELLDKHHHLIKLLNRKISPVIEVAKILNRLDILQRLIEVVLKFELKDEYPQVFGAYVNHLCEAEDVESVLEAFDYITQSSVIIPATSVQNIIHLLLRHKRKVPPSILNAIFKGTEPPTCQF